MIKKHELWVIFSAYVGLGVILGGRLLGDEIGHSAELPGMIIRMYVQLFFFLSNKDDDWYQVPEYFDGIFGFIFYFLATLLVIRFLYVLSEDIRERVSRHKHEV